MASASRATASPLAGRSYDADVAARISVIVPVRDRRDLLAATLRALDAQTVHDFEVVVVDDGSTDGADELAATAVVAGRPVVLGRSGGAGAVAARTLGVSLASAPLLAFTDSDCEPEPQWLEQALAALEDGAALAHGPTVPARPVRPLERSVSERDGGLFPTCNIAVRREVLEAVGGFDVAAARRWRFRPTGRAQGLGFGEDTLFGWRVARAHPVRFVPEMVVRHHVFPPDLRDWLSRSVQAAAFPALVREVPELRRTMVHHGVLFTHRSRVPVYATAAAALTRRPALVAGTAAWWALHRYRHTVRPTDLPRPAKMRALPAQMLLDVVQAGALVVGSARARTLLL
jgi:GT2 family glycosyltransferase